MKLKFLVAIALGLFSVIILSIGTAGLILYRQQKSVNIDQKLASADLTITDNNPTVQSDTELGGITAEAVSKHASANDCWMIVGGNVYDFTKFLNSHPGGVEVMTLYCGRDGTNAFNTKDKNPNTPHSQIASDLMNQYFLGKLGVSSGGDTSGGPTSNPQQSNTPTITLTPTSTLPVAANNSSSVTMTTATVASHNSSSDCWIIISNNVYAVTNYLSSHPGGSGVISNYCGRDATNAFNTKDRNPGSSHSSMAVGLLGAYIVGRIGAPLPTNPPNSPSGSVTIPTFTPTPTTRINTSTPTPTNPPGGGGGGGGGSVTLTATQVSSHNTLQDCWMIISNKVYNLTNYISQHPGGTQVILTRCGQDGSSAFATRGGTGSHSGFANNLLNNYYIGDLGASVPVGSTPTPTPTNPPAGGGGSTSTPTPTTGGNNSGIPASVMQKYPDATLIGNISHEDDGRLEFKINTGGQCRSIKTNSSGAITEDKSC